MNNPRRIQRHLVKAFAAGALLAAAALPLAIATVAGAATAPTLTAIAFTPHGAATNQIGANASGTATFTGSGFANNGANNDTLTASCTGGDAITFAPGGTDSVVETSATTGTASFVASGTAAGTCTLTLVDANGTSNTLATGAIVLDATPVISSISPASVWEGSAPTTVTISGSNFATPSVTFTNNADGTSLTSSITSSSASSIVLSVTPTNPANSAPATASAFTVTVSDADGGSTTTTFTVNNGLENVSPSATNAIGNIAVSLLGSGFEYGATVSLTSTDTAACFTEITNIASETINGVTVTHALATSAITSPTTGTATIPVTSIATPVSCGLTVTNGTGFGNNTFITNLAGAFGVGQASTVAPVIASISPSTALVEGAAPATYTLTGSGFSFYSGISTSYADVALSAGNGAAGTSYTFSAAATTGVTEGTAPVTVAGTTYGPALTVAGPVIASQAPSLVQSAAFGTSIVLTGTGFTNTTTGSVTHAGGGALVASVTYASPTTMNLVVTTPPNGVDATPGTAPTVQLTQTTTTGTVLSNVFTLTVNAPPAVTSAVTYATGAGSDVGVGATAQKVYIHGSGFETGATVTAFVNGAGVADPNVTATVTAVTASQITATVAIKGPDTNATVGYTVTNPDGGVFKVAAFAYPISIGAGPTITSVTPATGAAAATTSFAVAGTGFQAGAVVTLTPANGTCGVTTVSASTTLAVTCTLGDAGVTPTSLVVSNPDGGTVTSAPVLAAETAPAFHVSGVHGAAVVGKTVTVTITGTGFYGQPKITSAGFKFGVTKDSGSALTVRVTASASAKSGEHSLTVTLANGKSGKAGFNTKK